jgi:hypothetical protein
MEKRGATLLCWRSFPILSVELKKNAKIFSNHSRHHNHFLPMLNRKRALLLTDVTFKKYRR